MATQADVIQLHEKHPDWTAPQIAARLGCAAAYVRATAQRRGLTLPKSDRAGDPLPVKAVQS